jgi:hypothetical protein
MMCIISKERMSFCAQVEGTQGEIFAMSPIALHFLCQRVPNEHIPMYGHSRPQRQSFRLTYVTDRARGDSATAMGGRYAA